jgi:hypothetical protein
MTPQAKMEMSLKMKRYMYRRIQVEKSLNGCQMLGRDGVTDKQDKCRTGQKRKTPGFVA